jgi:thiamine-phosphate diphosphorylase
MSTFKVLAVSNRKLCSNNFLEQIDKIAAAKPSGIILREKDLTEEAYKTLALGVMEICKAYGVRCILHSFVNVARSIGCRAVHLPLSVLKNEALNLREFEIIGASAHSTEEAIEAERLGASYITAGHIFATDCKQNLAPQGLTFLINISKAVYIPVYAIGGITPENTNEAVNVGAEGVCVMSGFMKCEDPLKYMKSFKMNDFD